jgi:hypothetical protein
MTYRSPFANDRIYYPLLVQLPHREVNSLQIRLIDLLSPCRCDQPI